MAISNLDGTSRASLVNYLKGRGYNETALNNMSSDELMSLSSTTGETDFQRRERDADRKDTLEDFSSQLSGLTASKQRQAEQAGRISQNNVRTQGLAQMMSNF